MQVCKTVLIIGNHELAEPISQLFRKPGVYFGIFESPEGFTSEHGRLHNTVVKISNSIKALQPQTIIIAGCSEQIKNQFRDNFKGYDLRELEVFDEAQFVTCPGFIYQNKRMTIATHSSDSRIIGDIIVVDPKDDLTIITAKNLATAMKAIMVILPAINQQEIDQILDYHYRWNSASDSLVAQENKEFLFGALRQRLGNVVNATLVLPPFKRTGLDSLIALVCNPKATSFSSPSVDDCNYNH